MEDGTLDAAALTGGKESLGGGGDSVGVRGSDEANAVEGGARRGGNVDAEFGEGGEGVRHEAFTAGFVDGRRHAVDDLNREAPESSRDGAGQTCRASTGDEDICGWYSSMGERSICKKHRREP